MEQIIEVGLGKRPTRKHPSVDCTQDCITESIEDYAAAVNAPDFHSALNHITKTAKTNVGEEHHGVIDSVHTALSGGLNVESFESAHKLINGIEDRKARLHLRGAYTYHWGMNPKTPSPNDDISDLNHNEASALNQVGFTPSLGHEVVSKETGISYRYNRENGSIDFTKHSFRIPSNYPGHLKIWRQPTNQIEQLHDTLVSQTGDFARHHMNAVHDYTNFSETYSRLHIGEAKGKPIVPNDDSLSANFHERVNAAKRYSPVLSDAIKEHGGLNTKPFTVYTGVSRHSVLDPNHPDAKKDENGHVIYHAPAFSSTSIKESVAHDFLRDKPHEEFGKVHDVLKIEVPAHYKHGMYVEHHSKNQGEYEYLLDKGHRFVVDPNPSYIGSSGKLVRTFKAKLIPPTQESES